jgi:hypothetical protein
MNWEQKTQMVAFSNGGDQKSFINHVLKHLNDFDEQDWDIFIHCIELTKENISKYFAQHKIIYKHEKEIQYSSFASVMRATRYSQIMENLEALNSEN